MTAFPAMTQFPSGIVNYQLAQKSIAQTYERVGLLPYQYYVTTVGDLNQLFYYTARAQNLANSRLNKAVLSPTLIPEQYTFTTDLSKLNDFFKIRLYSPKVNRNPIPGLVGNAISSLESMLDIASWVPGAGTMAEKMKKAINDQKTASAEGDSKITDNLSPDEKKKIEAIKAEKQKQQDVWYNYLESDDKSRQRKTAFYGYKEPRSPQQSREDITADKEYAYTEIILPTPVEQILDTHTHDVNAAPLNPVLITIAILADVWDKWVGSKMFKDPNDKRTFSSASTNLAQYGMNLISAGTKTTFNPNAEVLYQSPQPRQFQFTFNYVPRNIKDSNEFIKMCEKLKEHSYPISFGADTFYKFPGTCDFEFWINNKKAVQLPYNKVPCLLTSVQVSYLNGTGTYTHFYDGNPTSMVLTLTFMETELLSRANFIPQEDYIKLMSKGNVKIEGVEAPKIDVLPSKTGAGGTVAPVPGPRPG